MEGLVQLNEIGQIAITVQDLARAKEFYRDVLGMKFLFDAGTMCFFQCGSVRLMVTMPEQPVVCGGTILYFRVNDIHETHRALLQKGVKFVDTPHVIARMPDHDLWMTFLKDPDENLLGLMCEMAQV